MSHQSSLLTCKHKTHIDIYRMLRTLPCFFNTAYTVKIKERKQKDLLHPNFIYIAQTHGRQLSWGESDKRNNTYVGKANYVLKAWKFFPKFSTQCNNHPCSRCSLLVSSALTLCLKPEVSLCLSGIKASCRGPHEPRSSCSASKYPARQVWL